MSKREVVFEAIVDEASGLTVRKTEWVEGIGKVPQKTKPLTEKELEEIWAEVRTDANC